MLSVEECLESLATLEHKPVRDSAGNDYSIASSFDRRFISDVTTHTRNGKAISTSQGQVGVKLIQRYRDHLIQLGAQPSSVDQLIMAPTYRMPLYQSTALPREVRWAGDSILVFRCKYNDAVVQDIKRLKSHNPFDYQNLPIFLRDDKLWLVHVSSANCEKVMNVIKKHRFAFDSGVEHFFMEVANSEGQRSQIASGDNEITITVRNDDFLAAWVKAIGKLEG